MYVGLADDALYTWGVDDATSHFVGHNGVPDSGCYTHLWDGMPVDVAYSFEGRSGGWLSINRFEGYNFTSHDWRDLLAEIEYATLRKLYQLVRMLAHDLERPESAVEYAAAFSLFENACADVVRPDALQLTLQFSEEFAGQPMAAV